MNSLIIYSNQSLSTLNIRTDVYNQNSNTLTFRIIEGNYQKIVEGGGVNIQSTTSGYYLGQTKYRKGFTVKCEYSELNLVLALRMIAKKSLSDKIPITIRDSIGIELDQLTDLTNGYTDRVGYIMLPIEQSETVSFLSGNTRTDYFTDGFSFKFMEKDLRTI